MIPEKEWEWYGHAGHFICGQWCRFHMTTKVGDHLISTVGLYVPPHQCGGSERRENEWLQQNPNGAEIGAERFYETMVFEAGTPCDAPDCGCGLPGVGGCERDFAGYQTPGEARKGHMEMCRKWARGGSR